MDEKEISRNLAETLKELPKDWIILLESKAENSTIVSLEAVKIFAQKGFSGIIVTASRPYSNLLQIYNQNNIKIDDLFFIDCVSKAQGAANLEDKNVFFLESVSALTEISIALDEKCKKMKNGFFFIDSLSSMLIHNKPEALARFVHGVLIRMRLIGIGGIMLLLEQESAKEIRAELAQLCDRVIKV